VTTLEIRIGDEVCLVEADSARTAWKAALEHARWFAHERGHVGGVWDGRTYRMGDVTVSEAGTVSAPV
jgi:hypothetical protein